MRRAAAWADGVYVFSMSGDPDEIERMLALADAAWQEAGREEPPRKIAGFWYSLADGAEAELRDYVYRYLAVFGDEVARAVAKTMKCFEKGAILKSSEAIRALGCDELIFSPATAGLEELERLLDTLG